jgi:hypothetical protein
MTTALLTSVVLLTLAFRAPAPGAHAGQAHLAGSQKPAAGKVACIVPGPEAGPAQDTMKAKSRQLPAGSALLLAEVRSRFTLHQPAAQTTEQPDSPEAATVESAAGFDPETANLPASLTIALRRPAAPLGRRVFRSRLVRTGRWVSHSEAVEILTCTYAGPLVLAQLPATATAPGQLLAGPGYDPTTPLRPLALTQEAVLHLCGDRAPQVRAYAMLYNLHFEQADEVARLLDYYNRIAMVVSK